MSEEERREQDTEAAKDEFERVIENLIESKVPWTKLFNKTELNQGRNETKMDAYENLWGINTKTLIEHLIEENG